MDIHRIRYDMEKMIIEKPEDIEKKSFEIIGMELSEKGIVLPDKEAPLIKRLIHTSADFDYAETLYFSEGAWDKAISLLTSGADIVTDTNMTKAGINKTAAAGLGIEVHCFMADPEVAEESKKRSVTRAEVSMEKAAGIEKPVIFAIGNAPTALIKLREMHDAGIYRPAFIIGVPVGFVNVVYAKELIMDTDIPCIINRGRKGGSNIAAAAVNALMYSIR